MERRSEELKVVQSVRGPAGAEPCCSLRDPSGSDLNKGPRRKAGERRASEFLWL